MEYVLLNIKIARRNCNSAWDPLAFIKTQRTISVLRVYNTRLIALSLSYAGSSSASSIEFELHILPVRLALLLGFFAS